MRMKKRNPIKRPNNYRVLSLKNGECSQTLPAVPLPSLSLSLSPQSYFLGCAWPCPSTKISTAREKRTKKRTKKKIISRGIGRTFPRFKHDTQKCRCAFYSVLSSWTFSFPLCPLDLSSLKSISLLCLSYSSSKSLLANVLDIDDDFRCNHSCPTFLQQPTYYRTVYRYLNIE